MLMYFRIVFGLKRSVCVCVLLTVRTVSLRGLNYMTSKYTCSFGLKVTLGASVLYKLNAKRVKLILSIP